MSLTQAQFNTILTAAEELRANYESVLKLSSELALSALSPEEKFNRLSTIILNLGPSSSTLATLSIERAKYNYTRRRNDKRRETRALGQPSRLRTYRPDHTTTALDISELLPDDLAARLTPARRAQIDREVALGLYDSHQATETTEALSATEEELSLDRADRCPGGITNPEDLL